MTASCPQFAFELRMVLRPDIDGPGRQALDDAFSALLAACALTSRGRAVSTGASVILSGEAGQTVDDDRAAVRAWADSHTDVMHVTIGPLFDQASD